MSPHTEKLQNITTQVKSFSSSRQPISFSKNSVPHIVPNPKDPRFKRPKINLKSLNDILEIDADKKICVAESGVAFVDLVRETLKHGLVPMTVPELKTITIGGAVSGCSVESMSYKFGGFHDSCLEYEVVTSDGCVVTCSRAQNSDIFEMIHGSYGTLGILTKLTFKLIPARTFVKVDYVRFSSFDTYWKFLQDRCAIADDDFIDGIIHSNKHFVVCLGNFVDTAPRLSRYDWTNIYYKSTAHLAEDYSTTSDYFFRYDTECHWLSRQIPLFENKLFRWLLGKYFLGSTNLIKWSRRLRHIYGLKKRQDIVVDVFIPSLRMAEFFDWYQKTFDFYPLWLVPYKMDKIYHWVSEGLRSKLKEEHLFIDCAIYGKKNDDLSKDLSKELEDKVFELNGVKTLIGQNHYSKERFWEIYNHPLIEKTKNRVDPKKMFGELYSKMCC